MNVDPLDSGLGVKNLNNLSKIPTNWADSPDKAFFFFLCPMLFTDWV